MTYAPEFVAEVENFRANSKDLPDPMMSFPPFKYALESLGEAEKLKQ